MARSTGLIKNTYTLYRRKRVVFNESSIPLYSTSNGYNDYYVLANLKDIRNFTCWLIVFTMSLLKIEAFQKIALSFSLFFFFYCIVSILDMLLLCCLVMSYILYIKKHGNDV